MAGTLTTALTLAAQGLAVFPCLADKRPACPHGFKDAAAEPGATRALWHSHPGPLIGVPTGAASGFDALDLDPRHGAAAWWQANVHRLPETRVHRTRSGGLHVLFRHAEPVRNTASKLGKGVDTRGTGGYIIWWPAHGCRVSKTPLADWPGWLLERLLQQPEPPKAPTRTFAPIAGEDAAQRIANRVLSRLAAASEGTRHYTLRKAAWTLGGLLDALPFGQTEATERASPRRSTGRRRRHEQRPEDSPMGPQAGRERTDAAGAQPMRDDAGFSLDHAGELVDIPAEFSDECLALRFTGQYGQTLRYVAGWGRWLEWDGAVWKSDETMNVFNLARRICRQASSEANKEKVASIVASAKTVAAVERLAKADRQHAATVDQWDSDPWLLNTPAGVVDLRTGRLRPHNPADYMTKATAVAPWGECPLWHDFLRTVTNHDADLQGYIQRMAGYCLTGSIREHALFFAFGTGANGKGVCINTLTGIMGDYAAVASIDTFTASQSDRHPTDLAMLRGARLVTAQETEEGRRWAEARIKAMTGGDPITARFMRQDFFTFEPRFKLLIAGNHRPGLRNVDEAIRRRFNLVPFAVKIAPEDRDHELPEKLKAEWPGILAWAIEGCLEWQRIGLAPPAAVLDATSEYLAAEDATASWLGECCIVSPHLELGSSALFASWKAWADKAGEFAGSQKRFSQALQTRGFETAKNGRGVMMFRGVGLIPSAEMDARYPDR